MDERTPVRRSPYTPECGWPIKMVINMVSPPTPNRHVEPTRLDETLSLFVALFLCWVRLAILRCHEWPFGGSLSWE